MTVNEFAALYPHFTFDFTKRISVQKRILDLAVLIDLPNELGASYTYRKGSRGRPNLNQTLTHAQCTTCQRVLRNDYFYAPLSMITQKNLLYPHCISCTHRSNAYRYDMNANAIRERRNAVWQYLAPHCAICGFDDHVSAMDMHHVHDKDSEISNLITQFALAPNVQRAENLLREASRCIPLCSNCHRMVHAGVIALPSDVAPLSYHLATLMKLLTRGSSA